MAKFDFVINQNKLQTLMAYCSAKNFTAIVIIAVLCFGFWFLYSFFIDNFSDNHKGVKSIRTPLTDYYPKQYSIHILTWNVAGKKPHKIEKLLPLLGINSTFKPDIIVVGIQEIVHVGINIGTFLKDKNWPNAIEAHVFELNYVKIDSKRNNAMNLLVYALQQHTEFIEQLDNMEERLNPLTQLITHKSGQSIRFQFYLVSLAFTNSHLRPGEGEANQRTNNYFQIKNRVFSNQYSLADHDYHFWFGDLNFRLQDLSSKDIMDRINEINSKPGTEEAQALIDNLLEYDELKKHMQSGIAFTEYSEPKITFTPTYKFHIDSDEYDLERRPSYTDRILYKTLPIDNKKRLELENVYYGTKNNYRMSDHRPVTALYLIRA